MLADADFNKIRQLINELCWIDLNEGKKELVKARLGKRLRALSMDDYAEYVDLVMNDTTGIELSAMVDVLTTNLTSFFRGEDHFDYLKKEVLPADRDRRRHRIRIWSAGCSSGEEAFSIAIVCRESIPHIETMDVSILGTDISSKVVDLARRGIYSVERLAPLPAPIRQKYFTRLDGQYKGSCKANDKLRELVRFRRHNLAGKWPMKGPFHAVFCRNVMIYFPREAKEALLKRFHAILNPEGVLFIGHSESLKGLTQEFRYVAPGIYRKQ